MITGAKIREARQALKLTQAQCAEKAGINPSEWSMIENAGRVVPDGGTGREDFAGRWHDNSGRDLTRLRSVTDWRGRRVFWPVALTVIFSTACCAGHIPVCAAEYGPVIPS